MATPSKGTGVKPTESNGWTKVPGTHSTTASEESMEMEATLMTDKTNAAAPPDADHVKVGQATQMMPRDIRSGVVPILNPSAYAPNSIFTDTQECSPKQIPMFCH